MADGSPDPAVYGVFHGIDAYFLSIESMLETCIAWVEQPDYHPNQVPPNEAEIWRHHNPGLLV